MRVLQVVKARVALESEVFDLSTFADDTVNFKIGQYSFTSGASVLPFFRLTMHIGVGVSETGFCLTALEDGAQMDHWSVPWYYKQHCDKCWTKAKISDIKIDIERLREIAKHLEKLSEQMQQIRTYVFSDKTFDLYQDDGMDSTHQTWLELLGERSVLIDLLDGDVVVKNKHAGINYRFDPMKFATAKALLEMIASRA